MAIPPLIALQFNSVAAGPCICEYSYSSSSIWHSAHTRSVSDLVSQGEWVAYGMYVRLRVCTPYGCTWCSVYPLIHSLC